jgi:hypothetical protein
MGDGFMLEVEKITEMELVEGGLEGLQRKIKIGEKMTGTVVVKRDRSPLLFSILQGLFEKVDP